MVAAPDGPVNGRARRQPRLLPRKPPDLGPDHLRDPDEDADPGVEGRGSRRPAPAARKKSAGPGRDWADHAGALAAWTRRWMVNRDDAWGQYLPPDQRSNGKAETRK